MPGRALRLSAAAVVAAMVGALLVAFGGGAASAVSNLAGSALYDDQVFFAYVDADETLNVTFTRTAGSAASTFTATAPDGSQAWSCANSSGPSCATTGLTSATAGVWTITFDTTPGSTRYSYTINALDGVTPVTGRIWTTQYNQYQSATSTQNYWVATREGHLYGLQFINYNGIGSTLRANGFGLVEAGTCTPIYQSAQGTSIGANGVFLDPSVEYSDNCGDDYLLFFEEPAGDLPASAPSAAGTTWIRPTLVPPSATNLAFVATDPLSRAGSVLFDLAGVNGGYEIQIDTNADGDYDDPTDRIIPWGSPPGEVTVPFDGLDGLGEPIEVCQAMNARVVVDRVGETHFVLEDVEQLGNAAATAAGIRLTGLTPGILAPPPLLYWDDTALPDVAPGEPFGGKDGTAGVDTTLIPVGNGAHGWRNSWGDVRSIENWTYYQANAGAEVAIEAPCNPSMTIDKIAELDDTNENGFADVGETIAYSFLVSNTGNALITGVAVTDDLVSGITPASADLPAGSTQLFTADPYVVTQNDVDSGSILNSATATGMDPGGDEVETPPDSTITLGPDRAPRLAIEKTGTPNDELVADGLAQLNETIGYSFLVTNTGNVTLTDVTVNDSMLTGLSPAAVTLAPGQSQVFTADDYTVVQPDLNTGSITNTATATGVSPIGVVESPPDTVVILTPVPDPLLELTKSGELLIDADADGFITPGDTVEYTFLVTNTGTVDLTDVSIVDPRLDGPTSPGSADIGANGSQEYTATYVVQQGDLDLGVLRNTAYATGVFISGEDEIVVDSGPDTEELPTAEREPALTIDKSGALDDLNSNGFADVGETITYSFVVTNTGNTTLSNLTVLDERLPALPPLGTDLLPGEFGIIASDPYVVTQADVDAGGVANVAVARGNIPGGPEVTSPPDEEFIDGPPPAPGLEIVKLAELDDENESGYADEGESVVYSFALTNTGNVTLFDVVVADEMLEGLLPGSLDLLPPGITSVVAAEPYTVTAADAQLGEIVNVAFASGVLLDQETVVVSEEDTATLLTPPPPGPGQPLPTTGTDPRALVALALGILLLGAAALLMASRRRLRSS